MSALSVGYLLIQTKYILTTILINKTEILGLNHIARVLAFQNYRLSEVYPFVRQKVLHLYKLKPHMHTYSYFFFSLILFISLRLFEVKGLIFYYIKHECVSYIQHPAKKLFAQVHPKPLWISYCYLFQFPSKLHGIIFPRII